MIYSYLRVDALANLLGYAGVHANGQALVFETFNGILIGAVAERMGGMQ
jgi:hypothetical protein